MVSEVLSSDSFKFKMHNFRVTVSEYFNTGYDAQSWYTSDSSSFMKCLSKITRFVDKQTIM